MANTLDSRFTQPQKITALIFSCSVCPPSWQKDCTQKKLHGICIRTKNGNTYGHIGSMEHLAIMENGAWCNQEVNISGAPQ